MQTQQQLNYERIASAIRFIKENRREQPKLEEVAKHVHMSPYHFQRTFQEWAGTSPKHFLQYLNVEYAKRILQETHASLFDTACEVGLSGTSRLYDLFVNIEGMTPGEYKNGGENLTIHYSFAESPFGEIFVASTDKGICCLEFTDNHPVSIDNTQDWSKLKEIKLHLKGTDFQLKVWEALLKIPMGGLTTYGDIASGINRPKACRAVGTAVGENPVALLIPCHRVIRSTGELGNYHWGDVRKTAIIGWEAARKNQGKLFY